MSKAVDLQFLQSIKEIFDPVFKDYGFVLREEAVWGGQGEYLVTATHGDMALNFWLSVVPMSPICYCTCAIMLTGELVKKANSNEGQHNTSLAVMNFAEILEPDYKRPPGEFQTNQELRERLEKEKEWLLKYCRGVLSGDMSIWSTIEKGLDEKYRR